ncbi:Cell wall protein [Actinidia chinensis var. chinensis]|uniref:Cell wall protein n=1 Tax=Actinidia chinensis var. chinensis TaxID=1590841 RepID=A0A2R6RKF3_ACTCC|nr:Cell wall protein [Actinidia chinensis var. chinensis]
MGTEIQAKSYFSGSGSIRDLKDSAGSGIWALYREHNALKNEQYYNSFLTRPNLDGYMMYDREQLRQTILKHESIFRHQLEELHRLYKRQRDLINEIKRRELQQHLIRAEMSLSSLFSFRIPFGDVKKTCHVSDFPIIGPTIGRPTISGTNSIQSSLGFIKGDNIFGPFLSQDRVKSKTCESPGAKCNMFDGRLLNLELPAAEGKWLEERACGMSQLQSCLVRRNCEVTRERNVSLCLGSGLSPGCNSDTFKPDPYSRRTGDMIDLNESVGFEESSVSTSVDNFGNVICLDEEIRKQSGFHILSKESYQISQNLPYKNHAGERRCNTVPFSGGACPENLPAPFKSLQVKPRKDDEPSSFLPSHKSNTESKRKRTIFGEEISEGGCHQSIETSHAPSPCPLIPLFDATKSESPSLPPWCKASSIFSQVCLDVKSEKDMNSSPMGGLPWLKEKELVKSEPIKGQEDPRQLNPLSLQNSPQLFADKIETEKGPSQSLVWVSTPSIRACDAKLEKTEIRACPSNSKTLECPIFVPQTPTDVTSLNSPFKSGCFASDGDGVDDWKDLDREPRSGHQLEVTDVVTEKVLSNYTSGIRHHIDLNLCMDEDEVPPVPSLPRSIFKIAMTQIDLEAPAVLEPEASPSPEVDSSEDQLKIPSKLPLDKSNEHSEDLVRVAAEAIIAISSSDLVEDIISHPLPVLSGDSLLWFAEVVSSSLDVELINDDSIPDRMDYFEFMTLNLKETEVEENCSMFPCFQNQKEEERGSDVLFKRPRRGQARRGRQRMDFQRDVLPGLVSLSRHEVIDDFQTIEELFKATGLAWQPSRSQRNAAKNCRGRRRSGGSSPSLTPTNVCPSPVEQPICRELVVLEERTLTGWGKKTRRLPRKRRPTDNPSHALKY